VSPARLLPLQQVPSGCTLAPADRAARVAAWRDAIGPALLARTGTPDGVRVRLRRSAALEQALAGLVTAEGDCCGHLALRVTADGDVLVFEVSGPTAGRAAIRRTFGLAPPVAIGPARPGDLPAVLALLAAARLPREGVAEHFAHFLVSRAGDEVVGAIGLEPGGEAGLLRSLVVAPDRQGEGVGRDLVTALLAGARQARLCRVFLLTETAAGFFGTLGFRPVERDQADPAVRQSVEFLSACPQGAVCMRLDLPSNV
jgi:amino-acid N-acetyltransferase